MAFRTTKRLDTEFGFESKSPDLGIGFGEDNDDQAPTKSGLRPGPRDTRVKASRNIQTDIATNEEPAENRQTK